MNNLTVFLIFYTQNKVNPRQPKLVSISLFMFTMLFLSLICVNVAMAQTADIKGVRIWHAPDHSRLVFDMSEKADFNISLLQQPSRYVIDFNKASLKGKIPSNENNTRINQIRAGQLNDERFRVVIPIKKTLEMKNFQLAPNQLYGHRLVVDLFDIKKTANTQIPETQQQASTPSTTANATQNYAQLPQIKKQIIIAVDAGHGGEDPGALGSRSREKNITLAISKRLARKIDNTKGMRAVLIRTGDYFVKLGNRIALARKANADLFVSIHADAALNKSARGMSVFALSQRGASSALARALARKQNQADLIGGVSIKDKDDELAQVLLDLSLTNKISESVELGSLVLKRMGKLGKLHSKRVEQAGFAVLKSPDIPSILVETGFITNRSEEQRLLSQRFQQQLVNQIYDGIVDYINRNPVQVGNANFQITPSNHSIDTSFSDDVDNRDNRTVFHTVRSGDSLSKIANRYGISLKQLKQWNKLKSNVAVKGKKLRVAPQGSSQQNNQSGTSTKTIRHTVKRGDSLSAIAQRYGDSMQAIRTRNNMKTSRVYIGQRLKINTAVNAANRNSSNQNSSSQRSNTPQIHIVKRGEYLSGISARYNISIKYLKRINNLKSNNIFVGQKLTISNRAKTPTNKTIKHKVRSGETLSGLALKYKIKQADIIQWNKLKKKQLFIGQRLIIKVR